MKNTKITALVVVGLFVASALTVGCSSKASMETASQPIAPAGSENKVVAQNTNLGASSSGYSR